MTPRLDRRALLSGAAVLTGAAVLPALPALAAADAFAGSPLRRLTPAEWRKRLAPASFNVLREEGTEAPFTSPLLNEHHKGTFACIACDLPLFKSEWKYDSHTGWPSFFRVIEPNIGRKADFAIGMERTEYHCARCLGHQGHVFDDGPQPTGLRFCNNGVALRFVPA